MIYQKTITNYLLLQLLGLFMRIYFKSFFLSLVFFSPFLLASQSFAKGQPSEWQISFQEAASPLMQSLIDLHDFVFWVITVITVFVFFLLAYVCVKFSAP
jgi:heme/copper-type cytochrome/quinol oxidase subunit 2